MGCTQGLERLTRLIFARAQPKRLGTQIISGSMLASLAEAYVDAINKGAVPTIATAWQVCSRAVLPWAVNLPCALLMLAQSNLPGRGRSIDFCSYAPAERSAWPWKHGWRCDAIVTAFQVLRRVWRRQSAGGLPMLQSRHMPAPSIPRWSQRRLPWMPSTCAAWALRTRHTLTSQLVRPLSSSPLAAQL